MRISACVITKNEEKNIGKWLQNMSIVADEMIVVDTGSTDATVEMAKTAGAKLAFFKWCNDFAAAKNYAINQATGDWIIFLDADEYFSDETCNLVRQVINQNHSNKKIGAIMCRLTNIDTDDHNRIIDSMVQVRIFRHTSGIHYKGAIHENLENTNGNLQMIYNKELEIFHTGYSSSIMASKTERNHKIVLNEAKRLGETPSVMLHLMDSYYGIKDYGKCIEYARKTIEAGVKIVGMPSHSHAMLIKSLICGGAAQEEIYEALDEAIKEYPDETLYPLEKGYILYTNGDFAQSEKYLKKGFKLRKTFEKKLENGIGSQDESRRFLPLAYAIMGELYRLRNRNNDAVKEYIKSIKEYRYQAEALLGICKCMSGADNADIIQVINSYYDKVQDADFIVQTIYGWVDPQVILYYRKNHSQGERYMAAGRYDSAAIEIASNLRCLYNTSIAKARCEFETDNTTLQVFLPKKYQAILAGSGKEYKKEYAAVNRLMLNNSSNLEVLAATAIENNDIELALRCKNKLSKLEESPYKKFLQARIEFMSGQRAKALELLENTVNDEALMKNAVAEVKEKLYNLLGQCYKFYGFSENAVNCYLMAVENVENTGLKLLEYSNYLFNLHYLDIDPQEIFDAHKRYDIILQGIKPFTTYKNGGKKIRIGYLSSDFRNHVVFRFMQAMLIAYNKNNFEVYCYSTGNEDNYTDIVRGKVDNWHRLVNMPPENIAEVIHDDGINILVELSGHSRGNNLPVLAYKPAPVQVCGIGYFDTTGMEAVDYFMSDKYLNTGNTVFTEKILELPESHLCYTPIESVADVSCLPALEKGYVTFGSFNNFTKVNDEVLKAWSAILAKVPKAELLLKSDIFDDEQGIELVSQRLEKVGIDLSRVEVRGFSRDYMTEYNDVDIALDTFPYPGGGTTCDALYMGVPVITLYGDTHHSRFGYSVLMNIGLAECCADSIDKYVDNAVQLANDLRYLQDIRQSLRKRMLESTLMNSNKYMNDLENMYKEIWKQNKT